MPRAGCSAWLVQLVYYDDQSNPAQVPGIYSKLLDVDKVDLIVSGYASTQIAAAMPIAITRKKLSFRSRPANGS